MTKREALKGKPFAGNPHARFDEGEVASTATPRRGSLLYSYKEMGGYPRRLAFHSVVALTLGLARVLNASAEDSVVFNIPEGETQCPTAGEFAELAGRTVVKRGAGRLVMTDTAAKDVDLVYEDGSLAFTRTLPADVVVSAADDVWFYTCAGKDGTTETRSPFAGESSLYVGSPKGNHSALTVRTIPVALVGRMKISGTVRMSGSGSWGFALVLHNDPRGYAAKADQKGGVTLGYASENPIRNSFAVGFVNFYDKNDPSAWIGQYRIGKDGAWTETATTDPLIYFNPYDGTTESVREFGLVLESDAAAQTVTLTLTQDQDGSPVVFTRTWADVDLVSLCGGETAYLGFTTDSGGRSTVVEVSALRIDYALDTATEATPFLKSLKVATETPTFVLDVPTTNGTMVVAARTEATRSATALTLKNVGAANQACSLGVFSAAGDVRVTRGLPADVVVSAADDAWFYTCAGKDGTTETRSPFAGESSLYVGSPKGEHSALTVRTMPVALVGRMKISGTVRMSGSGSWGFALVLHNDPRGAEAKADWAGTDALGYASGNPIRKSFAVGFVNHSSGIGSYRIGADGAWVEKATTDPLIYFNPYDAATQQTAVREFGLVLESDAAAQTVTLTLTQDQDGSPVVFTRTWAGVDLVSLCGGETAYLAFTTDSGGRTTEATIENLRVAYSPDSRVDVLTDGAGALPNKAILALDAVNFVIDRADKFDASTSVDLVRGATLKVMNGVEHRFLRGVIEGVRQTPGTYSASDCDWVTGEGSVRLGRGYFIIIR